MRQPQIRVVLIEDNRVACDQLAAVLEGQQANVEVVATASCVTAGLAQVQKTKPHIALVDADLCKSDSQLCLEGVRQMAPETRVIVMDVLPAREDIIGCIAAGANGFVLKDASVRDLVGTIQSVAQGKDVVPAPLTSVLWSQIAGEATAPTPPGQRLPAVPLTKRELQITHLIAEGLANKEIAQRINIATHTVKSHVHNILKKLGLRTRLQIAVQAGWADD